ncbi:MAG: hypothetical protein A2W91_01005 [Bacteroidetes bacterium GWF2_38_335]|nr:MAG: hypothetical protein A2W91_01005 [Bacteroidetes bacterium GWF2_38_335]OFY80332.1 MAG: hypothetical protein A2281_17515 [Bacteroidetes bacterium RIFOXYA12_FULL_38_20]HBS88867.1 hypothetical protein [Bacteroidales bacterium]
MINNFYLKIGYFIIFSHNYFKIFRLMDIHLWNNLNATNTADVLQERQVMRLCCNLFIILLVINKYLT